MLKYLVAEYIRDEKNMDSVVKLITEFYSTDVRIGGEINIVRKALEDLGEVEVLKEFEKGRFSGVA